MIQLLERVASLVNIASVSRNEQAIADLVEHELQVIGNLEVTRIENNVVARTQRGASSRIVLGGHLDTVPPSGNDHARIDGDRCFGCGSADMKAGIAVLLELAEHQEPAIDVTYVFYACEEIARSESGLLVLHQQMPELLECDAAVLLEPTSGAIEAGCQGVVRATVELGGVRAHSARPWAGRNAIHRLQPLLGLLEAFPERSPILDGCTYRESLQAVKIEGGVANNVIPDRVRVTIGHRFAPDRSAAEAVEHLRYYLAPALEESLGDCLTIIESAPAALPQLDTPLLSRLVEAVGVAPRAKLAWTDVAFFAEQGIPALNFGPGNADVAHGPDEYVDADDLEFVLTTLARLINA